MTLCIHCNNYQPLGTCMNRKGLPCERMDYKYGLNDEWPTEPGGYWCEIDGELTIAHVYLDWDGESTNKHSEVLHVFFANEEPDYCQLHYLQLLNKKRYRWSGRLPEPE